MAGRTAPGIGRITFTGPTGRTLEAAVTNGFFIVRNTGPGIGLPDGDQVRSTVRLYTSDGTMLASFPLTLQSFMFQ